MGSRIHGGTESGHIGQHEGKPIDKAQVKRLLSKGIKPHRNQLPPLPTAYSKLEDHPLYEMFKEAEKTHLQSHQQMKSWTGSKHHQSNEQGTRF
ncbi:hypothetical protein PtrM4_054530 [Pyrenophora tritici-repentis]|uniref:Uncharacterized protein n=1 Tax=Pyrenophora tritici-repentis TaxID=45151 RepID=A0A834VKA1_9PLEO|nr:hypothetical protein PtrM4_054530 [Pyrenophora tritici-repentis]